MNKKFKMLINKVFQKIILQQKHIFLVKSQCKDIYFFDKKSLLPEKAR